MRKEDATNEIKNAETKAINEASAALSNYTKSVAQNLAKLVASLCGITVQELLYDTTKVPSKHARWLFWYTYKQITNESCSSISKRTEETRFFCTSAVSSGITNMGMMVSQNPIWSKRWAILKSVINEINEVEKKEQRVLIKHPKGVKIELMEE